MYKSKMLWAFGNYNRFIPMCSKRIEIKMPEEKSAQFYLYLYINDKKQITVVINTSLNNINLELAVKNNIQRMVKIYITSNEYNLKPYKEYKVPIRSIYRQNK